MSKTTFTREDVQKILESNALDCEVSYMEREGEGSPGNWIVYERVAGGGSLRADDVIHMRLIGLQVTHYHKRKLDSIEDLMREEFGTEPSGHNIKQLETDYWGTYYNFDILTTGEW